jgi:hypothetical protein
MEYHKLDILLCNVILKKGMPRTKSIHFYKIKKTKRRAIKKE